MNVESIQIYVFTLPPILGMKGVWLAAPVIEAVTLILSLIFIVKDNKRTPKHEQNVSQKK